MAQNKSTYDYKTNLSLIASLALPDVHFLLLALSFSPSLTSLSLFLSLFSNMAAPVANTKHVLIIVLAAPLEKQKQKNTLMQNKNVQSKDKVQNRDQKLLTKFHSPVFLIYS